MDLLNKIVVFKTKDASKLSLKRLLIGLAYKTYGDGSEYKVSVNVDGVAGLCEWFSRDKLIPLDEIVPGFHIRDIENITIKQRAFIMYRYKEYLERQN